MIEPPGKPGIAVYFSSKTTKKDTNGCDPPSSLRVQLRGFALEEGQRKPRAPPARVPSELQSRRSERIPSYTPEQQTEAPEKASANNSPSISKVLGAPQDYGGGSRGCLLEGGPNKNDGSLRTPAFSMFFSFPSASEPGWFGAVEVGRIPTYPSQKPGVQSSNRQSERRTKGHLISRKPAIVVLAFRNGSFGCHREMELLRSFHWPMERESICRPQMVMVP